MAKARFEWNFHKDQENQEKHGVAFAVAQLAFYGAGYWRKGKRIYERENQVHGRAPRRPKGRP